MLGDARIIENLERGWVMPIFVLIPGAGGHAAYWNRLVPVLEARGHRAIAVDIQENDPSIDLDGFADNVQAAIGDREDVVLVAQSLGGFTAPMIRKPVRMIVLVNAMIPRPGESPDDWWDNTGSRAARREADLAAGRDPEFDVDRHFLHDVPDDAKAELMSAEMREPSAVAMAQFSDFTRWPDVPTRVLIGRDDLFFLPISNAASQKTGWGSMPTRSQAVTWSRSAIRPGSPTNWSSIWHNSDPPQC